MGKYTFNLVIDIYCIEFYRYSMFFYLFMKSNIKMSLNRNESPQFQYYKFCNDDLTIFLSCDALRLLQLIINIWHLNILWFYNS